MGQNTIQKRFSWFWLFQCETLVYNGAAMRPDVNSCVNSIRIFATSNNYMWTTGNLLKERNFPQASLLSHLPKQIKFFPNEFKFPGSLRKTCLSVIGWGNSVITTYKKKSKENWICRRIWKPGGTIPWYKKKTLPKSMSTFSFYSMQKSTYLWLTDQTSDVYDLIDWAFDCILDEEISGIQGWYNTGRLLGLKEAQASSARKFECHKTSSVINIC